MQFEPGQVIGPYTVVRRLGQGGMSNVFLAQDNKYNREVVLKFPHEGLLGDVAAYERFEREVKIGQLLDNPHIQKLYELGDYEGSPYIVLEYIPGENLRRWLEKRDSKQSAEDFEKAVRIGVQVGNALAYAHSKEVAHRDLKPENIIITPEGDAKIMDFGIALLQGARRVTWGPMSNQVGTPDYMSPEQIQGGRGDARTDIYALGMMLYEIIAWRLPYEGDNALAVMNQHVTAKAPSIHKYRKDVPHQLEEIILKAIRRKPENRWSNMDEFVTSLENWRNVDAGWLEAERQQEKDHTGLGRLAGKMNIPATVATIFAFVAIVLIISLLVITAQYVNHSHVH